VTASFEKVVQITGYCPIIFNNKYAHVKSSKQSDLQKYHVDSM